MLGLSELQKQRMQSDLRFARHRRLTIRAIEALGFIVFFAAVIGFMWAYAIVGGI